jgi:hypothetical protein
MSIIVRLVLAGLFLGAPLAAVAQEPDLRIPTLARDPAQAPVPVMIFGVFHFHNPGADYAQFRGIDVLALERQREIEDVVEALARFAPTKVALERPVREADSLNAMYRRYREDRFTLTANEVHQLGFRLARRFGHTQVFPVDYRVRNRLGEVIQYAHEHEPELQDRFDAYIGEIVALFDSLQANATIAANLRFLNEPENVIRTHEPYAVQAIIGVGDTYIGAQGVADWYHRNLGIFANLARIAEPGDRLLFIVGAGHSPILRELVIAHPDMVLVEAVDYLVGIR